MPSSLLTLDPFDLKSGLDDFESSFVPQAKGQHLVVAISDARPTRTQWTLVNQSSSTWEPAYIMAMAVAGATHWDLHGIPKVFVVRTYLRYLVSLWPYVPEQICIKRQDKL
ncbi:hypothetical protein VNO77_30557 [Canavalia gladiata]|uniref:Uncharacterized protein n=1 Tax=Canavalia gladiata TaxID=3824 RepID=A0AAN9KR79_CANGL